MENEVFGEYALYYDLLYSDKDYGKECDFLESVFMKYAGARVESILDLGCGSGNHVLRMAQRGYSVTGLDVSEGMLRLARDKSGKAGLQVEYLQGDMRKFSLDKTFDAVVCLFAAFNYIRQNDEMKQVLSNVKRHLKPGGLAVFDSWNGLAVMGIRPENRTKVIEKDSLKIIRVVTPEMDAASHECRNHYRMFILENSRLIHEIEETHVMRFLFPQEIAFYFTELGFHVLRICVFPKLDRNINENEWNMAVIARLGDPA